MIENNHKLTLKLRDLVGLKVFGLRTKGSPLRDKSKIISTYLNDPVFHAQVDSFVSDILNVYIKHNMETAKTDGELICEIAERAELHEAPHTIRLAGNWKIATLVSDDCFI